MNVLASGGRRDALLVVSVALAVRLAVVAYAASRFPPADDGTFYHVVASRIASGLGYTWLWPDGAVTYAAHYPVGYPALVGLGYALFGSRIAIAMLVNAVFGTLAAFAAHSLAATTAKRGGALAAGLFVALEPALVLYTPALMTEGVAGALLVASAALAANPWPARPFVRAAVAGVVLGMGVLVRPELIVLAPIVGLIALRRSNARKRAFGAAIPLVTSLAVCLPWTLRNCERLERCALVSVNGGWNLYIGSSPLGGGGWAPLERIGVPAECRTVFAEAEKDACFGRAGLRAIGRDPLSWFALVPRKLAATFDYGTPAAHYLSASNPALVGDPEKTALGATELLAQRVLLLVALVALARAEGPRRRARFAVAVLSGLAALLPGAWVGWIGLVVAALLLGRKLAALPTALLAMATVAMTAGIHALFFGASRYTLVCLPALAALAGSAIGRSFDPSIASGRSFDSEGKVAG